LNYLFEFDAHVELIDFQIFKKVHKGI